MIEYPYPVFDKISIECNSFCNRSCNFCTRTYDSREKVKMSDELIFKVLNELHEKQYKGLISFHFYNEIFTDKRIFKLFEKCKELELYNYIFTNGDYLTKEIIEKLSTYNIKEFALSIYDWKTEEEFIEKSNQYVNDLNLKKYPWEFYIIKGGDGFGNRAGNIEFKKEKIVMPLKAACSKIENKIEVRYDGKVVMCCQDYYGLHKIGDIREQNIYDIWYSDIRRKQISDLAKGLRENYSLCSKCTDYIKKIG
jgi:radical SAM protein with 4Fe4S-binding SPASM domain